MLLFRVSFLPVLWGLVHPTGLLVTPKVSGISPVDSSTRVTRRLTELTTFPKAERGSKTFALIDSYDCDNDMVTTVRHFFKANAVTFDTCVSESGYQIYPYTGVVPDAEIVTNLVNANACMGIVTAVVLLNMPPCMLDNLPMRAACETLLYYSEELREEEDQDKRVKAPSADEFSAMMTWRRDVDLARAAREPFDGTSEAYAAFTSTVRRALASSKVQVLKNYTVVLDTDEADPIEVDDAGKYPSFVPTNSSMDFFVGRVVAADDESDNALVVMHSKSMAAIQSSAAGPLAVMYSTMVIVLAVTFLI
uniref:Elicitin n=1 Tax=Peronospora matthiolae TaxID=2874970 RepID=A0AAV1U751_9STRA